MRHERLGRFSYMGASPFCTIEARGRSITIRDYRDDSAGSGFDERSFEADPFDALRNLLARCRSGRATLPFSGGAVGYFAYDLGRVIERLPSVALDDVGMPDMYFALYDAIVAYDHVSGTCHGAISAPVASAAPGATATPYTTISAEARIRGWIANAYASRDGASTGDEKRRAANDTTLRAVPSGRSAIEPCMTKERYIEAVERIREYIGSGDIYQANMTQRFSCDFPSDRPSAFRFYRILRERNPAPFAAFLDLGDARVYSSSPERFLEKRGNRVETRPIKGTRRRGATDSEDRALSDELLASEKDRAELLMIVDLERNDLGKTAKTGSVRVDELFKIETYATVHHLVASVGAEIDEGLDGLDCVRGAFPGGSITGAPKIRAMEIIEELEPFRRGVYTGSLGYIGFDGDMDLNICIRTVVERGGRAHYQVGGGIVWDSTPEDEYDETEHKGSALRRSFAEFFGET